MDIALRTALESEKAALEARYMDLEKQIATLRAESESVSARLSHVIALLREPGREGPEIKVPFHSQSDVGQQKALDPVEMVYHILEEMGPDPVYYRELADSVRQRGGNLEGSNPGLTLISRLVLDDRFVRPFRRGWYSLRKYYPRAKNVGCRRSTASKKRSSGRMRK